MDGKKEYRIALVIKTQGLEYDDRVRKEVLTIQKLFPNIRFKLFPMLNDNREEEGVCSYGVPYKAVHSLARDKYAQRTHKMEKAIDFYFSVRKDLKGFDAVWCGDYHTFVIAALCGNKNLLWDLHELPSALLGNLPNRLLLKYIFRRCKCVIHANPQRIDYLKSRGLISNSTKHFALRNYPNFEDVDSEYDQRYYDFVKWKGDKVCIYLQGLSEKGRAGYETVSAVLQTNDLHAVVVGYMYEPDLERLKKEYGYELDRRIFFAGKIAQMKIPQYVGQCIATLVFYQNTSPNNLYCEANRFYQSVIMGLPVVVGYNPSMKELVDKYGFGVSIDDDGTDVAKITAGIKTVLDNYEEFHQNNMKYRNNLLWNSQEDLIKEIVNKYLN